MRKGIRDKAVARQLRELERLGYTVTLTGGTHYQVRDPEGKRVAWVSGTSVNRRQPGALRSAIRRAEAGR